MNCPMETQESAEVLLAYCARSLDPDTAAILERHIEVCPQCAEFRRSQQMLWSALDAWDTMPVSRDFNRRLYRRIDEEERKPWSSLSRWFSSGFSAFWRTAYPIAAACVVIVAGYFVQHPVGVAVPADLAAQPRLERLEAEQAEGALEDMEMLRQLDLVTSIEKVSSKAL